MKFDVNINNKQTHWVLVVIDKCKGVLCAIWRFVVKCFKLLWKSLKKTWKYILSIVIIIGFIIGSVCGYYYYKDEYIPKKKRDAAIKEIVEGIYSKNDSIKTLYSLFVLDKKHEWGYDDVSDYTIDYLLKDYREDAFKQIEAMAYSGNSRCQFVLGQMYYWTENYNVSFSSNGEKAAYWWNEAAQQGYVNAYNNIGIAYLDGMGVKKDLKKAVEYLKKGAEAGEDLAQKNYGDLFVEGVTIVTGTHKETRLNYYGGKYSVDVEDHDTLVPNDIEQAKYWWKKSAAQGNEMAKDVLQKIYE